MANFKLCSFCKRCCQDSQLFAEQHPASGNEASNTSVKSTMWFNPLFARQNAILLAMSLGSAPAERVGQGKLGRFQY